MVAALGLALGSIFVSPHHTRRAFQGSASVTSKARRGREQPPFATTLAPLASAARTVPGCLARMREFSWSHQAAPTDTAPPAASRAPTRDRERLHVGRRPQFAASVQLGKLTLGGGWFVPWGGTTLDVRPQRGVRPQHVPRCADGISRWHGYRASACSCSRRSGRVALRSHSAWRHRNVIVSSYEVARAQNSPVIATTSRARCESTSRPKA